MNLSKMSSLAVLAAITALGSAGVANAQTEAAPATTGCADDIRHNATREQISFESRGKQIPGLIYRPAVSNGAAIVLLHGFTGLQGHAPIFDPHAVQMASRGYTVLVPSYFDARPWRTRFNGQDIRAWSEASLNAVRFLATQPGIDPQRVGVWGYSLGGFLATDRAMTDDTPAALAIGVSAGTAIYDNLSQGGRPIPILMLHGRSDPSVSLSSMDQLAANLAVRGATVEKELFDANDHMPTPQAWCQVFQRSRAFMDAHLLPAPEAAAPAG